MAATSLGVTACAVGIGTDSGRLGEPIVLNIGSDLDTYARFGAKNAGGEGDTQSGEWIEARLQQAGFSVERQSLVASVISEESAIFEAAGARAPVASHTLGAAKQFGSVEAPLRIWGMPDLVTEARGCIVVAHLPSQRWSSAEQPLVRQLIERSFGQGAVALVLVTHGPTRKLIKLNRLLDPEARHGPVALLAPEAWMNLAAAAHSAERALISLNATETTRSAFNVIGRIDRGRTQTIVISTPRSGWTACLGERGPGISCFLALARSAPALFPRHNLTFICTSAHEFENSGAAAALRQIAPRPEETDLWLHLGAGFAARDWHETGGQLVPLPSADPQRFLLTSPHLLERARTAFSGLPGLEAAYSTTLGAAGELSAIVAEGYPNVVGMLGTHRFHHVSDDDMRCVAPELVQEVLDRLTRFFASVTPGN